MASLVDLFNPSFFIILGIVTLLIALVVVYFESKMREQNHKIASMLSLVSTLAEDMNNVKMGLNHLAITRVSGGGQPEMPYTVSQDLGFVVKENNSPHLIEVSDDSESESDNSDLNEESIKQTELDDINDYTDYESVDESVDESVKDIKDSDNNEIVKIIKLNITENVENDNDSYEESNHLEFNPEDDLDVLEDICDIPEISEEYTEEILSLKYDEVKDDIPLVESNLLSKETVVPSTSELKTISINLGEDLQTEHIEYKKLQLPKLKSITIEKGLATSSEVQKLKKPELLKLLGVE